MIILLKGAQATMSHTGTMLYLRIADIGGFFVPNRSASADSEC
jgi:hypothetical protein